MQLRDAGAIFISPRDSFVTTLRLEDFVDDTPWTPSATEFADVPLPDIIEGVRVQRLPVHRDLRGELTVLITALTDESLTAPHVYHVRAEPRSIRAWVYHKRQADRLAYVDGRFRLVLYDLRPGSKTHGRLNVMDVGAENRVLVTIPPFVIHGLRNLDDQPSAFVNMPTKPYDPAWPDKSRIPYGHPGIPYVFD
jgi:dTDP-4-dehydrorhamnose 3,5-epimerase